MRLAGCGLTAALLLLPAAGAAAQDGERRVRLESLDVSDNLYLLRGGGANILALVREDGVLLVDTLGPGWGAAIRAALDNLTSMPVTTIINTHAHAGHAAGNAEFPQVAAIVAHENARRRMATMDAFQGPNARYLPSRTFSDTLELLDGVDRVELRHFGPAHTDGDALVVFPEKGIAYLGDLFPAVAVPRVDRAAGGSALRFPDAVAGALEALSFFPEFVRGREVRTFDRVVPGHQQPPDQTPLLEWLTWSDLERYAAFTRDLVDVVSTARADGRGVDEAAAAAGGLADRYPEYDLEPLRPFVAALYDEAAGGR